MNKREYIENATKTILNRVKFHAPIVFDASIDKSALQARGIDVNLPIFKFDKQLNIYLIKAFENAQKEQKFNLVINEGCVNKKNLKRVIKLPNCFIFNPAYVDLIFLEMINKLNINYQSSTNYNPTYAEKFIKVNGEVLNPFYKEFALVQKKCIGEIEVDYREFVLNGNNYFLKIINFSNIEKKIDISINLPLEKGYFYFKKQDKFVKIENLLTKKIQFFNFISRNSKFRFSCVDGLENSKFCCINVKASVTLKPKEVRFFFYNLGEGKLPIKSNDDFERLFSIANQKCCEIFNLKVKTKNPKFDQFFNNTLPKKIWLKWNQGEYDKSLDEKYITLRRLFIRGSEKLDFVPFKEIGLQSLGIYNGEYYKKILVSFGAEKFLQVGKTKFFNVNGVTMASLKKNDPIMLSFQNY